LFDDSRAAALKEAMELHLILAQIEPTTFTLPSICPQRGCDSGEFRQHQQVTKSIKDTTHQTLDVYRYQCVRCGHTFRVYPHGVTHAHTSRRVQELAILLHLLGLSFGNVSLALDVFGVYLSKSRVYDAVQKAKARRPHLTRANIFHDMQRHYQHGGVVYVRCMDQWLPLTLSSGECCGLVLKVSSLSAVQITALRDHVLSLVTMLGGQVKITGVAGRGDPRTQPGHDTI
jgi:hypothetical protein